MFVAYNEKSFVPAFLRSLLITNLELLSTSKQRYRVTNRSVWPPLVRLNFIADLLSALTFVSLLTFEFSCAKGELR